MAAELTDHLGGYVKGDPGRSALPNARNGSTLKTVLTEAGPVPLEVLRDREGLFTPRLVPKGQRRIGGPDDMIISLYAGGMTLRDIQFHPRVDDRDRDFRETIPDRRRDLRGSAVLAAPPAGAGLCTR